jgi:hypothetical protein
MEASRSPYVVAGFLGRLIAKTAAAAMMIITTTTIAANSVVDIPEELLLELVVAGGGVTVLLCDELTELLEEGVDEETIVDVTLEFEVLELPTLPLAGFR